MPTQPLSHTLSPMPESQATFRPNFGRNEAENYWVFTFKYGDRTFVLDIYHAHGGFGYYQLSSWVDGQSWKVVTQKEYDELKIECEEHEDEFDDSEIVVLAPAMQREIDKRVGWCLDRWNTIQTLVSPSTP